MRVLATADGKGRIALRLSGTSRKEHRQLTQQAIEERGAGWREAADARASAAREAEAAWEIVRSSPYASVLGATERQAPDIDTLAPRLTEMRGVRIPAHVQRIDTGDEKRVSRAHGRATLARQKAAAYRAGAADARTEQVLRGRIAEHHPSLHRSENRARAESRQAQEALRARQHQRSPRHQPSVPGRAGPSRGQR